MEYFEYSIYLKIKMWFYFFRAVVALKMFVAILRSTRSLYNAVMQIKLIITLLVNPTEPDRDLIVSRVISMTVCENGGKKGGSAINYFDYD